MNQGGLKHAATESRLDNKRERRRGASGRAAALRRAPSDSDCSGETASLSADSGERVVRLPPPPTRATKSRSRRRGSEWEVLEGLKDGQRFEKRPDVFNGYLHKKRKWPLKGWHKRFFVVDGGILVYARSPTDVARGRLHGSVDVGLSVISAKARRRRIDIDADEFIYHLRAKTADVFRTWLNVLKAHRLYRQHLLTFGARESVPKIHAPLEDLPPTDTSSRTSRISLESPSLSSSEELKFPMYDLSSSSQRHQIESHSPYESEEQKNVFNWKATEKKIIYFNFQKTSNTIEKISNALHNKNRSLCSMNCCARLNQKKIKVVQPREISQASTNAEKQMHITDLESNSLNVTSPEKTLSPINNIHRDREKRKVKINRKGDSSNSNTYYFFTRKKRSHDAEESVMRKSRKSTNLVKYRNICDEPPLKEPFKKCLLMRNYRMKSKGVGKTLSHRGVACDAISGEYYNKNKEESITIINKEHKSLQDLMTTSEYDEITEQIMVSLFNTHMQNKQDKKIKYYVNQVVRELYEVKFSQKHVHPVKVLFRSLLEYWLKNTNGEKFREALRRVKSVGKPSNSHFTEDKLLSSFLIKNATKQTQFHGISDFIHELSDTIGTHTRKSKDVLPKSKKKGIRCYSPKRDTESFEKERRIQELEKILKNTVYVCETARSCQSKENDIRMTRRLIDNLEKFSKRSSLNHPNDDLLDKSYSSSELPRIQETINQLISDTSMPPDIAKEFLYAYLGVLLNDSSKSVENSSSQSSEHFVKRIGPPVCDVETEAVQKRVSKCVTTANSGDNKNQASFTNDELLNNIQKHETDPGEQYLKDVIDKITTIFTKNKTDRKCTEINDKSKGDKKDTANDELCRPVKEYPEKKLIHENYEDNSVVIDLSKYDLEHISMFSDPNLKGVMSITLKLKEKSSNLGELKRQQLSLKFCNELKPKAEKIDKDWIENLESASLKKMFEPLDINLATNFYDISPDTPRDTMELRPYISSSDATSKAYCRIIHESEHSIDLSFQSSNFFKRDFIDDNEETQSCFIVSSLKKNAITTKLQSRKKVRLKQNEIASANTQRPAITSPVECGGCSKYPDEYTVFERPTPKIIDEKFILLLLENLTLLSKNLPSMYKDINTLYLKLRKKNEKVVRTCGNIQGLSLLGRIYNDDYKPMDRETQYDAHPIDEKDAQSLKIMEDVTTSITSCGYMQKTLCDTCQSACNMPRTCISSVVQTDSMPTEVEFAMKYIKSLSSIKKKPSITKKQSYTETVLHVTDVALQKPILEQAISTQNWHQPISTKECAISTIIKTILDNPDRNKNFCTGRSKHFDSIQVLKLDRNFTIPKYVNEINTKEVKATTRFKMSKYSQTDDIRMFNRDFNVYQLIMNKNEPKRSNSMVDSLSITNSDELKTLYRCNSEPSYCSGLISPTSPPLRGPQAGFVSGTPGGRLAGWIIESGGPLENASRELGQAQLSVQQLQRLLQALDLQQQLHHDTDVSLEGASPNVKKDRRKFGLRKKKSNSKCASVDLQPPHIDPSTSHMALSALTAPPSPGGGASSVPNSAASLPIACAAARPQSLPGAESLGAGAAAGPASLTSLTPDHQLREDFTVLAKDLVASLKGIVSTLVCERGRLRAAMDASDTTTTPGGAVVAALRTNLTSALQQNSELRSRLSRIHDASDLAEMSSMAPNSDPQVNRQFQQSLSYSSSCVSASEFFDAEEHDEDLKPADIIAADEAGVIELDGDSSSEAGSLSSEEGSASSDNSDGAMLSAEQVTLRLNQNGIESRPTSCWSRRTCLPCPRPTPGGPSLWNLLYKNIGKDLSQISMPVTINEPLNMLQRLCEELEYSELLDSAAECKNAVERMALIAAFAVSAYASSAHRAASKPFNPLLSETYECVRDDRGFRFIAEQVSHHPPISACHAESPRWCFWQEARIKTKFWGKSMEFQPAGRVHVRLVGTGDHYSWNKVTTCVHNLFGGQRWVDQYGDMHITCHGTDITCKLNFIKASSWSSSRHEVRGSISVGGSARLRLQGRWSEALYAGEPPAARCLWRPGAMPPEHDLYYGFTRFAMELNELEPGMRELLPNTDTRLRPDQRALEEGDVESAEQYKHELEQAQRERRRESPQHMPAWFRKSVEGGEEMWVFSGEYWKAREAGFSRAAPAIW